MSMVYNDLYKTTIKRKIDNESSDNNDNGNEYDETQNSKKSRHTLSLSTHNLPSNVNYLCEIKSNHGNEFTSTRKKYMEQGISSESSIKLTYTSQRSHAYHVTEETSSFCYDSPIVDQFEKVAYNNKTLPLQIEGNDNEATIGSTKLLPAFFKTCIKCRKHNTDSYYQYCDTCFKKRMELIMNKSKSKPKSFKFLKSFSFEKESNENNTVLTDLTDYKNHICNICFVMPKNGLFNHAKLSHTNCCYHCAKNIWKKSKICPICNAKIKSISKLIL